MLEVDPGRVPRRGHRADASTSASRARTTTLTATRRRDLGAVECACLVDATRASSPTTTSARRCVGMPATRVGTRPLRALGRPAAWRRSPSIYRPHVPAADTIAHGCTGKGNDQARIEATARHLGAGAQGHRPSARVADGPRRGTAYARASTESRSTSTGGAPVLDRRQPLGTLQRRRHRSRTSIRPRRTICSSW